MKICPRCLRFKAIPECMELIPISASRPMELVHMDFLIIESQKKTNKDINILIVTDHFMCCAQAFVTRSQTASVVVNTLWNDIFPIMASQKRFYQIKVTILRVI